MTNYPVMYEQADDGGWAASAVDLPVYAFGETRSEAEKLITEAIVAHLEWLAEDGADAPSPTLLEFGVVTV